MKKKDQLIDSFIKSIPFGSRVLDVGCGSGKTVRKISKARPDIRIVALDMEDSIGQLPSEVDFRQADLDTISFIFEEDAFDVVICQHVIEHLLYPHQLISDIKRILKPGGKLFVEVPNWTRLFIPFHPNFFWSDYTHIRPYSTQTIQRIFFDFGFRVDYVLTVSSASFLVGGDSLLKFFDKDHQYPRSLSRSVRGSSRGGVLSKVFSRLVNPFLKDLIFAVGINEK